MKRLLLALSLFAPQAQAGVLLSDTFSLPNGLITNEYATYSGGGKTSPIWLANSGSLFATNGSGWTGKPDHGPVNAGSTTGTNSAVFRMNTRRADFQDVSVSMRLYNQGLLSSGAQSFDGVHVWLRYVSEESLYALTVNRRDNILIIKKKVPGGPSNGGTYYTLGQASYAVPYRSWQTVAASAQNQADGSVALKILINGATRLSVVDRGTGGAPLRQAAKVGVRGDNCDFLFDDFTVAAIGASSAPPAPPTPSIVFTSVRATELASTSARIVWQTNAVSHSQVKYGPTTAYGTATANSTAAGLYHGVLLPGLRPGTLYHYRAISDGAQSQDFTFTTPPAAAPSIAITNVKAAPTSTGAHLSWTTNVVSHSQAKYGLTAAYGSATPNSTATGLYHGVTLSGLKPATAYHYSVISDGVPSGDFTFKTAAATSGSAR